MRKARRAQLVCIFPDEIRIRKLPGHLFPEGFDKQGRTFTQIQVMRRAPTEHYQIHGGFQLEVNTRPQVDLIGVFGSNSLKSAVGSDEAGDEREWRPESWEQVHSSCDRGRMHGSNREICSRAETHHVDIPGKERVKNKDTNKDFKVLPPFPSLSGLTRKDRVYHYSIS